MTNMTWPLYWQSTSTYSWTPIQSVMWQDLLKPYMAKALAKVARMIVSPQMLREDAEFPSLIVSHAGGSSTIVILGAGRIPNTTWNRWENITKLNSCSLEWLDVILLYGMTSCFCIYLYVLIHASWNKLKARNCLIPSWWTFVKLLLW